MKSVNRAIVEYIAIEWVSQAKSVLAFANDHGIDEKTVRLMRSDPNYRISLETLIKICEAREIKLKAFFILIDM